MKFLIIGDLHIGKTYFPFLKFSMNKNFKNEKLLSFWEIWSHRLVLYVQNVVLKTFKQYPSEQINVVFLGDIVDHIKIDQLFLDQLFKIEILSFILNLRPDCLISIVVGNHDKNKKTQVIGSSILKRFADYRNKVKVYEKTTLQSSKRNIIYFPYIRKEELIQNLVNFKFQNSNHNLENCIVFAHNQIYINDSFGINSMFQKKDIERALGISKCTLFNGHNHTYYYEPDFFLTGSVGPTSMKESFQSSGICLYDPETSNIQTFKNNKMVFMSISSKEFMDQLSILLNYAKESDCMVALQVPKDLKKYLQNVTKKFCDTIVAISLKEDL